jgi:hypothetical protein
MIESNEFRPSAEEGPASPLRSCCPPGPNIPLTFGRTALARGFCQVRSDSRKHADAALTSGALLAKRDAGPLAYIA